MNIEDLKSTLGTYYFPYMNTASTNPVFSDPHKDLWGIGKIMHYIYSHIPAMFVVIVSAIRNE